MKVLAKRLAKSAKRFAKDILAKKRTFAYSLT